MLTYPWKCTVLHCNHLGNTWKPLVLMTRQFDYCPSASEGDNQSVRSSAPVVSRCFPGGYNVKLYISRGRLAWWLLAFLHSVHISILWKKNHVIGYIMSFPDSTSRPWVHYILRKGCKRYTATNNFNGSTRQTIACPLKTHCGLAGPDCQHVVIDEFLCMVSGCALETDVCQWMFKTKVNIVQGQEDAPLNCTKTTWFFTWNSYNLCVILKFKDVLDIYK